MVFKEKRLKITVFILEWMVCIKYFISYLIIMFVLHVFEVDTWIKSPLLSTLQFIAMVIFVIITHNYITYLKKMKCECSNSVVRDVLQVVNYVQMFLMSLILIIMIYITFALAAAEQIADLKQMFAKKNA